MVFVLQKYVQTNCAEQVPYVLFLMVRGPFRVIRLLDNVLTGKGCKIAPGIRHHSTTGLQVSFFA